MPTGYTADIAKGISFEEFALQCARAFGALIMMRDEPADKLIPKEFKPSKYHSKEIAQIEKRLKNLKDMTEKQANEESAKEYQQKLNNKEKGIREAKELRAKYLVMLGAAQAWIPPSSDHAELKNFMIEQINQSIKFDCSTKYYLNQQIKLLSGKDWLAWQIQECLKDLYYHSKENEKEIQRTIERNLWIKQLRESLTSK